MSVRFDLRHASLDLFTETSVVLDVHAGVVDCGAAFRVTLQIRLCNACTSSYFQSQTGHDQYSTCSSVACLVHTARAAAAPRQGTAGLAVPVRIKCACEACVAGQYSDKESADNFQARADGGLPHTKCAKAARILSVPNFTADRICQLARRVVFRRNERRTLRVLSLRQVPG